ncbi:MAG TPA: FAD-dependent oxidoreductase [Planctomycetota bacterium]|nr:FAD-dependent oxidoreductase [Planctomycetota bacterium]
MDPDTTSGENRSCWFDAAPPDHPPLASHLECDVCVIGGGISGLSTAYRLAADGRDVVLLDDGRIGSGETGRTSAHLASALDDHFHELERVHGGEGARIAYESHAAAIDWIEGVSDDEGIECGFARVDGFLFVPPGDPLDILADELAAAHRAGLIGAEMLDAVPGLPFDTGPCLRFPDQAQFHPLRFLTGLAAAAARKGVRIHGHTHAATIAGGKRPTVTTASGHVVRASAVVVATNVPINDRVVMHTKLEPHRTYIITAPVPRGTVPAALYWDSGDPYHYLRVVAGDAEDLLVLGGEDHKVGQADDYEARYLRLERWLRVRIPMAGPIASRWSGQIVETVDDLGYIGRNPVDENVYIITGDSGNGLTNGVVGALIIGDLIAGRDNRWAALFDPARKRLRAAGEYGRHNANVAVQYRDWVTGGDGDSSDIAPGSGAVIRHGLAKVAVYCAPDGTRHACSAVCPHLKGIVHWNAEEGSWDCPAHGSRFDPHGRVMNGPANRDLSPVELPADAPPTTRGA